uniref:Uncharacterized protein n=1 Tax=Populus trichocarpa TaxID=3694 RepID=A0A3N7H869_POPTR
MILVLGGGAGLYIYWIYLNFKQQDRTLDCRLLLALIVFTD